MSFFGDTTQTTNTSQTGTTSGAQTGSQTGQLQPWDQTLALLQKVISGAGGLNPNPTGTENDAFAKLNATGAAGDPNAGAIQNVAQTLLNGGGPDRTGIVNNAYTNYKAALQPFASGSYVDPNTNPALQKYLSVAGTDAANSINSQFAGAGRDLSGINQQAVSRGVTQAEAPILYDAYNQGIAGKRSAIDSLYGAGNTTAGLLSGLDQIRLGNMQAGVGVSGAARDATTYGPLLQLAAAAQQRGIPLQTLATQVGIALPLGQTFGTSTGSASGTTSGVSNTTGTSTQSTDVPLFDKLLSAGATAAAAYGKFGGTGKPA